MSFWLKRDRIFGLFIIVTCMLYGIIVRFVIPYDSIGVDVVVLDGELNGSIYRNVFEYPIYNDCFVNEYYKPKVYMNDDMIYVRDIIVDSELEYVTVLVERLSLCEKGYKHEIFNKMYICQYYILENNQFIELLHEYTETKTQKKHQFAQNLFIDCELPNEFIKYINNSNIDFKPKLYLEIYPKYIYNDSILNSNRTNGVILPICMNPIINNNQILYHAYKELIYPHAYFIFIQ